MTSRTQLLLAVLFCLVAATGCTETSPGFRVIGPYVTDVTYDAEGNLVLTKEKIVTFAPEHAFTRETFSVAATKAPHRAADPTASTKE